MDDIVTDDILIDDVPEDDEIVDDPDETYKTPQDRPDIDTSSGGVEVPTPKRPHVYELKREVLRTKLSQLYEYLHIEGGNIDLIDLDRFKLERNTKTGVSMLKFFNGKDWLNLTNQRNGEFLAENSLKQKFGGLNAMKAILGVDEIPELDKTIAAAVKLRKKLPTVREIENIPLQDLSTLVNDVHVLTKEASQNTDLDIREFLGIDAALQRIKGEIVNNTSKITEIDRHIKREQDKLKEADEDQKTRIKDRIKKLKDERNVRLEISVQYRDELQTQVARIKQTIEKILDSDTSLAEKLRILFREQGITLMAIITAIGMIISTIVVTVTGGGGSGTGGETSKPPKDENKLKKWAKDVLQRLANALKRLAGKAAAALPGIIGSVIGAVLNYLSKAVGFLAKNTWAVIVFIAGIIGYWIYEKVVSSSSSKHRHKN